MAYTDKNFTSKTAVKKAIASGESVTVHQPGPFAGNIPDNGTVALEGPHYPKPHRWYGTGTMKDGKLVSIK